jgi:hypothetical protein
MTYLFLAIYDCGGGGEWSKTTVKPKAADPSLGYFSDDIKACTGFDIEFKFSAYLPFGHFYPGTKHVGCSKE